MNSSATKKRNIVLIAVFFVGSLTAIGYSGKAVIDMQNADETRTAQHQKIKAAMKAECIASVKNVDHSLDVLSLNDSLKVIGKEKIGTPYGFLTQISGAIQSCPGYELEYSCMGEDCEKSYFTMDLKGVANEQS